MISDRTRAGLLTCTYCFRILRQRIYNLTTINFIPIANRVTIKPRTIDHFKSGDKVFLVYESGAVCPYDYTVVSFSNKNEKIAITENFHTVNVNYDSSKWILQSEIEAYVPQNRLINWNQIGIGEIFQKTNGGVYLKIGNLSQVNLTTSNFSLLSSNELMYDKFKVLGTFKVNPS